MKQYSIKNPSALPTSCPPLGEGLVHLGLGKTFKLPPGGSFEGTGCYTKGSSPRTWDSGLSVRLTGSLRDHAYAAPEGSEIVKLNFGEPLGSWADKLPREYVDLILERYEADERPGKLDRQFGDIFAWGVTPEGWNFWDSVNDFILGDDPKLPAIPASGASGTPEKLCDLPVSAPAKENPTAAELVARIEKKLAKQDALLASISKLIADYNASNS
jgi:hypothetical protein